MYPSPNPSLKGRGTLQRFSKSRLKAHLYYAGFAFHA